MIPSSFRPCTFSLVLRRGANFQAGLSVVDAILVQTLRIPVQTNSVLADVSPITCCEVWCFFSLVNQLSNSLTLSVLGGGKFLAITSLLKVALSTSQGCHLVQKAPPVCQR